MKFRDYSNYEIYDGGRIWSYKRSKFLKPSTLPNGYQMVTLTDNEGKQKSYLVHRVVWESVTGEPIPKKLEINHIDEKKYKEKLKTKTPSVEQNVGNLSGGNQQKVLLAKWMFTDPDVLILDEPTRGIDVGAKYEIYCIINDLVAAGKSVIMISSELPEVIGMSDRIYIMNEAKIVGEMNASEATQVNIMASILQSGRSE